MSRVWCSLSLRLLGPRFAVVARRVIPLLAASLLLASCGNGDDSTDGGGDGTYPESDTPYPESDTPVAEPASGCLAEYPEGLAVSWTGSDSTTYVGQVIACTDPSHASTYIRNDSEAVFTLAAAIAGTPVTHLSDDLRLESFRQTAGQEQNPAAVLSPGADVIVAAPPADVRWTLDPQLSLAWMVHDTLTDKVEAFGEAQLVSMLSKDSARRRALVTCALTAYHAAGDASPIWQSSQPSEQLLAALGIGTGATNCARAWQAADDVELSRGVRTATWSDDIVRLADDADFLVQTNSRLTKVRNFARFIFAIR